MFVSLRMAASAKAPSAPMPLFPRLRAKGRMGNSERLGVSTALTRKRTLLGGGALERSHSAPLERLAQLGDGLHLVGTAAHVVEAAERVAGQAVSMTKEQECQ